MHTKRLLTYDNWANHRILEALLHLPQLDPEAPPAKLFSHIIAAEEVWLARVLGHPYQSTTFWPTLNPKSWSQRLALIHNEWRTFLDSPSTNLNNTYAYQNSRGQPFETSLHDIFTHLIIHGQHHRSQIALHLRELGQEPPPTDYIYFTRDDAVPSGDQSS